MMDGDAINAAAASLDEAERTGRQIGLLSLRHPTMTMEDAYAVQSSWIALKLAGGRSVTGWKIGLTSKAMQAALGIDIPDSGVLLDDMVFEDGAAIPRGRFIQPRVETEIAFVMKKGLQGPATGLTDVLAATDCIMPALEILDTRILRVDPSSGRARTVVDTIADNAANAGIVLGGSPVRPHEADMRWMGAIVSRNAVVEETGVGAGVLNHPARAVAWLARRLFTFGGRIEAGQVILSGSFVRPVEARPGDTIVGDFGRQGTVGIHFG